MQILNVMYLLDNIIYVFLALHTGILLKELAHYYSILKLFERVGLHNNESNRHPLGYLGQKRVNMQRDRQKNMTYPSSLCFDT